MINLILEISNIVAKFKKFQLLKNEVKLLEEYIVKIVRNHPSIIILEYIENEKIKLFPLHREVDLNSDNSFRFDNIITRIIDNNEVVVSFDFIDIEGNYIGTITPDNLITIYPILLNRRLNNKPLFKEDFNYTQRDYFSAFDSVIKHIEELSPDLAELISSRNTPDFLLLDALAYLYDRLQFYIDYAISNIDIEQARGKFLELLANFYSINIPIPSSSKLKINIILEIEKTQIPQFIKILNELDINAIEIKKIIFKSLPFSLPDEYKKISTTKGDFYFLDLPISFDISKVISSFIPESIGWHSYILYEQMNINTETFTIFKEAREYILTQQYVNPNRISLEVLNFPFSDYQIRLINDINSFYKVINEAEKLKVQYENIKPSYLFLPVYIDINRLGIGKLIFLDSLLEEFPSSIVVKATYGYHNGNLSNNAEFNGEEETFVYEITKDSVNLDTEIEIVYLKTLSNKNIKIEKNKTIKLKEIFKKFPFLKFKFHIIFSKYDKYEERVNGKKVILKSSDGTFPLSDEEIRSIILKSTTTFDTQTKLEYLKRAVVEEDYKALLFQNKIFDVLSVKIMGYYFPHYISIKEIEQSPENE